MASPHLGHRYVALIIQREHQVVDFWSDVFTGDTTVDDFSDAVNRNMRALNYSGTHKYKSFKGGLVDLARPMWLYHNGVGRVSLYFWQNGDFQYVSVRVYYTPIVSVLRVITYILLVFFSGFWIMYGDYSSVQDPSVTHLIGHPVALLAEMHQLLHTQPIQWVLYSLLLFVPIGLFSGLRTGDVMSFLYADFNELYRDDLAVMGRLAYLSVIDVADELSLKSMTPEGIVPPPNFGDGFVSASSKHRQRRI